MQQPDQQASRNQYQPRQQHRHRIRQVPQELQGNHPHQPSWQPPRQPLLQGHKSRSVGQPKISPSSSVPPGLRPLADRRCLPLVARWSGEPVLLSCWALLSLLTSWSLLSLGSMELVGRLAQHLRDLQGQVVYSPLVDVRSSRSSLIRLFSLASLALTSARIALRVVRRSVKPPVGSGGNNHAGMLACGWNELQQFMQLLQPFIGRSTVLVTGCRALEENPGTQYQPKPKR